MRLRALTILRGDVQFEVGDEFDCDGRVAAGLIGVGAAEAVVGEPEAAVEQPEVEAAVEPKPAPRKRPTKRVNPKRKPKPKRGK